MTITSTFPRALALTVGVAAFAACAPSTPSGVPATPVPSAAPTSAATTPTPAPVASSTPSAAPATAAPTTFAVTGIVTDEFRNPVSGATITARQADKDVATAKTDAAGAYTMQLASGDYQVEATKPGFTARRQSLKVAAAATLHFGQESSDSTNPYFISDFPEVVSVDVDEEQGGGPMNLRVHLSEPLPEASRKYFEDIFEVRTSRTIEFLRAVLGSNFRTQPEMKWEDNGQTFVYRYTGGYLASGETEVTYSVAFRQAKLTTQDPETREFEWENLKVADDGGRKLGRNRADYAFMRHDIAPFSLNLLTDKSFGFYIEQRRWNFTHTGYFSFTAKKDDKAPQLLSAEASVKANIGETTADLVTLKFSEPMAVAKDAATPEFTRLEKEKEIAIINVSKLATGASPEPTASTLKPTKIEFDRRDARTVYLRYPTGTFEKMKWIEVTLGADAKDPAGNKPDPTKYKAAGAVFGGDR